MLGPVSDESNGLLIKNPFTNSFLKRGFIRDLALNKISKGASLDTATSALSCQPFTHDSRNFFPT